MIHLTRMPEEVRSLVKCGFSLSGKHGRLIYRTRDGKSHIYGIRSPKKGEKMAKVSYATFVTGISGKSGNSVFFRSPSTAYGYLRNYVYPTLTATNTARGKEFANLTLQLKSMNPAAIADFKDYAKKFAKLAPVGSGGITARANNHVAVWILAVWNLKKATGAGLELDTVTLADIYTLFEWFSLADIITKGFLPAVDGWEEYDAELLVTTP